MSLAVTGNEIAVASFPLWLGNKLMTGAVVSTPMTRSAQLDVLCVPVSFNAAPSYRYHVKLGPLTT